MSKIDLSKELKGIYKAKNTPELIDVPAGKFLAIDGKGDPKGEEYSEAMMALYGSAYTLKFHYKAQGLDYRVMALEGLWWIEDGAFDMNNPAPRDKWRWTSMIRVPDFVEEVAFAEVLPGLVEKRGEKVHEVRLVDFDEGLSAQVMHIGPYSEETPTINMLHQWVTDQGYRLRDKHHEIYMSDPRRTKPENLKTIIRHPVVRARVGFPGCRDMVNNKRAICAVMSMAKPSTRKTLENYIFKKMSEQGIVGLSIATIKDGKPDYKRGFGFRNLLRGSSATPNSIYCIGSLTKAFTAAAILQLSEKGALSLDDPIGKYLPIELTAMGSPVLIKHLLSHSSGLSALGYAEATLTAVTDFSDHWLPISSPEDLMVFMNGADEWAMAKPGERYAYLNEGFILLGSIIRAVSRMEYADYVKQNILEPLGMKRSTYYEPDIEQDDDVATPYVSGENDEKVETRYPFGQMIADGGLMTNVVDMTKFLQMFTSKDPDVARILSEESTKNQATPKIKTSEIPLGDADDRYYAYGLRIKSGFFGYNLVYHSGSVFGSSAYMGFIPEKGVGVVIMATGGYFLEDIGELAIAQLLGVNPDDVPYFKRVEQLESLTGTYVTFKNTSEYEVKRNRGILHLETSFWQRTWTTPLIPVDLDGDMKRFMAYGLETMTPVEFVYRDGELLMFYENSLAKRVNGW